MCIRDSLGGAEQGGHAGHQVLAEGGGGTEYVGIAGGELRNLWGKHLADRMRIGGVGDGQNLGDASDLRGFGSNGSRIGCQHHDIDALRLQRECSADGLGGGGVELAVVVFGDD